MATTTSCVIVCIGPTVKIARAPGDQNTAPVA